MTKGASRRPRELTRCSGTYGVTLWLLRPPSPAVAWRVLVWMGFIRKRSPWSTPRSRPGRRDPRFPSCSMSFTRACLPHSRKDLLTDLLSFFPCLRDVLSQRYLFSRLTVSERCARLWSTLRDVPAGRFLLFITFWSVLVYDPVARWSWHWAGWSNPLDVMDFAGAHRRSISHQARRYWRATSFMPSIRRDLAGAGADFGVSWGNDSASFGKHYLAMLTRRQVGN